MLKRLAELDIRCAAAPGDQTALADEAPRILYQRKAFGEETAQRRALPPAPARFPAAPPPAPGPAATTRPSGWPSAHRPDDGPAAISHTVVTTR